MIKLQIERICEQLGIDIEKGLNSLENGYLHPAGMGETVTTCASRISANSTSYGRVET